jgi:hypothetical protein
MSPKKIESSSKNQPVSYNINGNVNLTIHQTSTMSSNNNIIKIVDLTEERKRQICSHEIRPIKEAKLGLAPKHIRDVSPLKPNEKEPSLFKMLKLKITSSRNRNNRLSNYDNINSTSSMTISSNMSKNK